MIENVGEATWEELLRYADRNSMAHSREVRLPFLQHDLVEFVFSLPSGMKIKDGFTKWILRRSMEQILPGNICWRKDKIGYEPPQQHPANCFEGADWPRLAAGADMRVPSPAAGMMTETFINWEREYSSSIEGSCRFMA